MKGVRFFVLACDPGVTTGIVLLSVADHGYYLRGEYSLPATAQLDLPWFLRTNMVHQDFWHLGGLELVCEQPPQRPDNVSPIIRTQDMQQQAEALGCKLHMYGPSAWKPFFKRLQWPIEGTASRSPHIRDALGLALWHLRTTRFTNLPFLREKQWYKPLGQRLP